MPEHRPRFGFDVLHGYVSTMSTFISVFEVAVMVLRFLDALRIQVSMLRLRDNGLDK